MNTMGGMNAIAGRSRGIGFRNSNAPINFAGLSNGMNMGMGLENMTRMGGMNTMGGMNAIAGMNGMAGMNGIDQAALARLGLIGGSEALNGTGIDMGGLGLAQDRNMYNSDFGVDALIANKNAGLIGSLDMVSAPVGTPLQTKETKVTIPNAMGGAVIGAGGSRIRQIRLQSKAAIKIGEPDDSTGQRVISIAGDAKSIQVAQYLLQQAVKQGTGTTRYNKVLYNKIT